MGTVLGREPVLILSLVQAAITVAVTFGLRLTVEQIGAILVLTGAVLSVIVRSKVTPA
jgi:hypothetical protein